jgi:LacI family transcriptional regulator
MPKATTRSIGAELGVSCTTVSLALRDDPRISEKTRQRIKKIAARLDYVPDARVRAAMREVRAVRAGRTQAGLAMLSIYPEREPWKIHPHLAKVIAGAREKAHALGYSLEYFWLKEPKMTPKRMAGILHARGIEGIFCLGSANPEEHWPEELSDFAITTFAMSIPTALHRVRSDFHEDCMALMGMLKALGYRRPGLCILPSGDRRTGYVYSGAFLVFQQRFLEPPHVPILLTEDFNDGAVLSWLEMHNPDIVVIHHDPENWRAFARRHNIRVPDDISVVSLGFTIGDSSGFSGYEQNLRGMGVSAIELLVGRVEQRDIGLPADPKIELVQGHWVQGETTRPQHAAQARNGKKRK